MASIVLMDWYNPSFDSSEVKQNALENIKFQIEHSTVDKLKQWLANAVRVVNSPELVKVLGDCFFVAIKRKVYPIA